MPEENQTKLDFATDIDFSDILTNPILDIAARFWEDDRYHAFRVCYRSMRRIDDLVDHRKETAEFISDQEAEQFKQMMADWLDAVRRRKVEDAFVREFIDVTDTFRIPFWPWERLYTAMVYDLQHDGYDSFLTFVRYTEGAAIAPASIFMHLCGISNVDGAYSLPPYDIRLAARPLALFSYLVHIVRDFQKDQLSNLTYFADNVVKSCGVTRDELKWVAEGGVISDSFRKLVAEYARFAEYYRVKARQMVDETMPLLEPRYQLSLELIYQLYLQIYEKIDPAGGKFTSEELNPAPHEVQARINRTLDNFVPVHG